MSGSMACESWAQLVGNRGLLSLGWHRLRQGTFQLRHDVAWWVLQYDRAYSHNRIRCNRSGQATVNLSAVQPGSGSHRVKFSWQQKKLANI